MDEKKKRLIYRRIRHIIFSTCMYTVIVLLIMWFIVPLFVDYTEPNLSPPLSKLMQQIEQSTNSAKVKKEFILLTIQEQERAKDKSEKLIKLAIKEAETYVKDNPDEEIDLALARLYFQSARVANARGNVLKASLGVNKGVKKIDTLKKKNPENLPIRMYRAINFASIPSFFGKGGIATEEFSYVADRVLVNSFNLRQEIPNQYYQNALLTCFETALEHNNKNKDSSEKKQFSKKVEKASKKISEML